MQINPRHYYEPAPKPDQVGNEKTRLTEEDADLWRKTVQVKYAPKIDPKEQKDKGLWA